MKVYNFCKMMESLGHQVYHYGSETSNPPCTEHVQIISTEEQELLYGNHAEKFLASLRWDSSSALWQLANSRAIVEILRRKRPRDFICLIGGDCQRPIASEAGQDVQIVEYGIGYYGVFAPYKVFESYAHMACSLGLRGLQNSVPNYEVVIPNYYDVADFPQQTGLDDYFLYLGRVVSGKGVQIAVQATAAIGARLLVAGQGVVKADAEGIVTEEFTITDSHVEFIGCLDVKSRAEILGKARALIAPSRYLEPFGGVAVEAQLMGIPVISSDWGAFAETVEHGVSGYRCRTLSHFVQACHSVARLNRAHIRERAIDLYSLERVKWMYQEYFSMLQDLWDPVGWGAIDPASDLNWLARASVAERP